MNSSNRTHNVSILLSHDNGNQNSSVEVNIDLRMDQVFHHNDEFNKQNMTYTHSRWSMYTLVNVKAPVVATTNWWWLISALVVA